MHMANFSENVIQTVWEKVDAVPGMMHRNGEKTSVRLGLEEINTEIGKVIMGGK